MGWNTYQKYQKYLEVLSEVSGISKLVAISMTNKNLIELDFFDGQEPGLKLTVFNSDIGLIKRCEFKDQIEWLKVGENTYIKRLDKLNIHFPLVFFTAVEAKKYGFVIPCNYKGEIHSYYGLTCDPEKLKLIESISFSEAIGNHLKIDKFKCPNCNQKWLIEEEYDSHHGTNRKCKKME